MQTMLNNTREKSACTKFHLHTNTCNRYEVFLSFIAEEHAQNYYGEDNAQ